ncbi:MAG: flavin reductase family protein [Beijerinckiaceae bacterium]
MNAKLSAAVSGNDFREAMSQVAGAVHIITTNGDGGLAGATATAVTSVSDTPPSLLVCLNQNSSTLAAIRSNKTFGINILSDQHLDLANRFAGQTGVQGAERFEQSAGWQNLQSVPVLAGALATFTCSLADMKTVGSHMIIIGTVEKVSVHAGGAPLLYHRRGYKTL